MANYKLAFRFRSRRKRLIFATIIIRNFILVISVVAISLSRWSASIRTIVGSGREETKDGHSLRAATNNPFGVTRGPDGALWFCEYGGHTIRRIDGEYNVVTVVGKE